MKLLKMFGLATLTALMAMAFVGADMAMGESTALCNIDPGTGPTEVCPAGHLITHVHEVTLSGAKATLLTEIFDTKCDVLVLGDTILPLRSPLAIKVKFTYTNCTENCTVSEEGGPGVLEILKTGHESGEVALEMVIHMKCVFFECYYDTQGILGMAKGRLLSKENTGEISFQGQELLEAAPQLGCPEETFLDIVTAPLSATHITK